MVTVSGLTYNGKDAKGFYSSAILSDGFKSTVTTIPNVVSGQQLAKLDLSGVLSPFSCSFSATMAATLATKKVTPAHFKINGEVCANELWSSYLANELKSTTDVMPKEFENYIMDLTAENIGAGLDNLVINGSISGGDNMDGLLVQFVADATVIDVVGTTVTSANVVAELEKVYNAIPLAILDQTTIFVSPSIATAYKRALTASNPAMMAVNSNEIALSYLGTPIEVIKRLPANDMFACDRANIVAFTALDSEVEDVKLISMEHVGEPKVRIVGAFTYGITYYIGAEIVYYT